MASSSEPALTCWLLDTRSIWQGDKIANVASEALELVSEQERADIQRKFRIQDARMSLASALLKRFFVSKTLGVPWSQVRFSRKRDPTHGKPCYVANDGTCTIEFNVSHQAGLVALVGCKIPNMELGVDIVCVNERNDYRVVDSEGFEGWVDIYQDIFSVAEKDDMKHSADYFRLSDGTEIEAGMLGYSERRCTRPGRQLTAQLPSGERKTFDSRLLIDAKLRRFYTFWCYKEAYIKLDGEALLAPWIKELEFRKVRAPKPRSHSQIPGEGVWGEIVNDAEVWLHNRKLDEVALQIQSFEDNFMISIAAKPADFLPGGEFPSFTKLNVATDIMDFADSA